jgi:glutathione S-transferase
VTDFMKIYDSAFSPNSRKVRAVVYELGVQAEFQPVNLFNGEARAPAFLALNPNALVPVMVDGDFVLWESNAIVGYLAHGTPLMPIERRERSEVDRWNAWHLAHISPAIWKVAFERLIKPMLGQMAPDASAIELGASEFTRHTRVLETSIVNREYVAGRLSVADFVLASMYSIAAMAGLDTTAFPRVHAWLDRVLARPSMKRALADAEAAMAR